MSIQLRSALAGLCAALSLAIGLGTSLAADRNISLMPGTDLPGYDYSVIKDTDLEACQAACVEDRICAAFTFNESAEWCFLKGGVAEAVDFGGATSGTVEASPDAATILADRRSELPFPGDYLIDEARRFATELPTTNPPPPNAVYADLVADGD